MLIVASSVVNSEEYDIMYVPQYLDRVAQIKPHASTMSDTAEQLKAYWTQQLNDLGTISLCSDEEALVIAKGIMGHRLMLRKISRKDNRTTSLKMSSL